MSGGSGSPSSRRYAITLLVLAVSAVGVLISYGATWAVATVPVFAGDASAGQREVALSGRDLAPLGAAMGWVGLAAVAALLATRTWGRRLTGGVVAIAGGTAGAIGLAFGLTEAATGGGGTFISAALGVRDEAASVQIGPWWIGAIVTGLAMLACGIVALVYGPTWPRLGARYARSAPGSAMSSSAAAWDALDRGEDPTETATGSGGPATPPPSGRSDPGSMGQAGGGVQPDEARMEDR